MPETETGPGCTMCGTPTHIGCECSTTSTETPDSELTENTRVWTLADGRRVDLEKLVLVVTDLGKFFNKEFNDREGGVKDVTDMLLSIVDRESPADIEEVIQWLETSDLGPSMNNDKGKIFVAE